MYVWWCVYRGPFLLEPSVHHGLHTALACDAPSRRVLLRDNLHGCPVCRPALANVRFRARWTHGACQRFVWKMYRTRARKHQKRPSAQRDPEAPPLRSLHINMGCSYVFVEDVGRRWRTFLEDVRKHNTFHWKTLILLKKNNI